MENLNLSFPRPSYTQENMSLCYKFVYVLGFQDFLDVDFKYAQAVLRGSHVVGLVMS